MFPILKERIDSFLLAKLSRCLQNVLVYKFNDRDLRPRLLNHPRRYACDEEYHAIPRFQARSLQKGPLQGLLG